MLRVVIDSNVVVRAVLTLDSHIASILGRADEYEAYVTEGIVRELHDVLGRERVQRRMQAYGVDEDRAAILSAFAHWRRVAPRVPVTICRDSDDDKFLECALEAGAEFLVTSDEDLLVLREFEGTRIITPGEFLEVLDEGEGQGS